MHDTFDRSIDWVCISPCTIKLFCPRRPSINHLILTLSIDRHYLFYLYVLYFILYLMNAEVESFQYISFRLRISHNNILTLFHTLLYRSSLPPPSLSPKGCRREDCGASLIARSRPEQVLNLHYLPYSAVALL
jgi:hypothetical protein